VANLGPVFVQRRMNRIPMEADLVTLPAFLPETFFHYALQIKVGQQ
jgi:hypothetical protein